MNSAQLSKTIARHKKRTTFGMLHKIHENNKKDKQKDEFQEVSREICNRIFGGKDKIEFKEYMEFRHSLQEILWHYEFHQFQTDNQDHISSYEFSQSLLVYYCPTHKIPDYLENLEDLQKTLNMNEQCCDVMQYVAFQYFLKDYRTKIISTVMTNGDIDFDGLRKLTNDFEGQNDYCKKNGVHIPNGMITAFLNAFDIEGNGILDVE